MKKIKFLFSQTKLREKAFTIVELLVVIGIISILAVALLITLNPADAQRKARDAQRVKDASTLQAILEAYLNDGGSFTTLCPIATPCYSSLTTGTAPATCGVSNWIGINFCNYTRTVPVDPLNGSTNRTCQTRTATTGVANTPSTSCTMRYYVAFSGGDYEIGVLQEAASNDRKPFSDGGATDTAQRYWIQIFSSAAPLGVTTANP